MLRAARITSLLFTGCTQSVCVESTLREAVLRGCDCILLEDRVAEPVAGTHDRTNHDATVSLVESVLDWVSDYSAVVQTLDSTTLAAAS